MRKVRSARRSAMLRAPPRKLPWRMHTSVHASLLTAVLRLACDRHDDLGHAGCGAAYLRRGLQGCIHSLPSTWLRLRRLDCGYARSALYAPFTLARSHLAR